MDGSISELLIARSLGIPIRPSRRWVPISVRWRGPQAGWYKANVDRSVSSAPGCMYVGVIFRNSRCFFAGAFCTHIGRGYPLEAELAAILHSILYAHAQGWLFLWVESDSPLLLTRVKLSQRISRLIAFSENVRVGDVHVRKSHLSLAPKSLEPPGYDLNTFRERINDQDGVRFHPERMPTTIKSKKNGVENRSQFSL
ncbi:hypothetical protein ACS0TY_021282 [Phlomoides rotata]